MKKIDPAVVLTYNDPWIQKEYLRILRPFAKKTRIVTYTPIESECLQAAWFSDMDIVDRIVLFHEPARELFCRTLEVDHLENLSVIPHGVDTDAFRPFGDVYDTNDKIVLTGCDFAKKQLDLFPDEQLASSFAVLNANRNQGRKRVDVTVRAFSEFARGKPDNVKLYLHMGAHDIGWDLIELARHYGIDDRLILTEPKGLTPNVRDHELNVIYNACDVGLNTASCEGWGLCAFEHAAAGRAQVLPAIPNLKALWGEGRALFVEPAADFVFDSTHYRGYLLDPKDVARALEALYVDKARRSALARSGRELAAQNRFKWDFIAKQWDDLFREVSLDTSRSGAI